jgi:hypothetical protein
MARMKYRATTYIIDGDGFKEVDFLEDSTIEKCFHRVRKSPKKHDRATTVIIRNSDDMMVSGTSDNYNDFFNLKSWLCGVAVPQAEASSEMGMFLPREDAWHNYIALRMPHCMTVAEWGKITSDTRTRAQEIALMVERERRNLPKDERVASGFGIRFYMLWKLVREGAVVVPCYAFG